MIAAHAISIGAALVTSDLGAFRRARGRRVVDWTK
jgi:predicted nucleic acid-binding protein